MDLVDGDGGAPGAVAMVNEGEERMEEREVRRLQWSEGGVGVCRQRIGG